MICFKVFTNYISYVYAASNSDVVILLQVQFTTNCHKTALKLLKFRYSQNMSNLCSSMLSFYQFHSIFDIKTSFKSKLLVPFVAQISSSCVSA